MSQYKELSEIDEKYRKLLPSPTKKILIDKDDYIALYNLAEYGELLMREQEEEYEQRRVEDKIYSERGY